MNLKRIFVVLALAACGSKTPAVGVAPDPAKALETYASNLYQAYSDAVADAVAFETQADTFLKAASEQSLAATRVSWLASRAHYMLVEGARFYGGPIDADPANHEGRLNAWPLDEAYLDYMVGPIGTVDESVGLINNPALLPDITAAAIDALNAKSGDENITNGYHAIEFLLWGQATQAVGPGTRPASDYVVGGPRAHPDRRAKYLRAVTESVIAHLTAVRDAWAPGADYRTQFVAGGMASVGLAFTGLARMSKGELGGQRMNAAYQSKARRDQHDCFSSNTLIDYVRDAQGLKNIYLGEYGASKGVGLDTLVAAVDPAIDTRLKAQLQLSVDLMQGIPQPFEASITGQDTAPGRAAILKTITALNTQADLLATASAALGQPITVPDGQ